ncbi:hypothetical protein MNBD_GAMMA15-1145 [hydrothermal vent metagenome]|uniref:Glycosyl transferase family 1 domain-containing protein n=1 Tax=hydrothermal vent metagenome TaxID=652676 RepID=A0A3B0Z2A0_9ZZZZ
MSSQNKIIVIGGGIIETDGDRYYARSQIVEYLLGLNQCYNKVTWMARLIDSHDYRTPIDNTGVRLDIINKNMETILSLRGCIGQIISYWRFARDIDRRTDIIVSEYSVTSMPYLLMTRLFGRKSLYYLGSDPRLTKDLRKDTFYGRFSSFAKSIVLPLSIKLANGVLVRGKSTYEQCSHWNSNIILSSPLISYKHFRDVLSKRIDGRQKDRFDILYVGKLEENKGVHVLLNALKLLQSANNASIDIRLNIIGSGIMVHELMELAETNNLGHIVKFHGFVDDPEKLADIFSASDLFVVPTLYHEGFPRVIDEAMVCGIPVICSRLGGMKDGLDENEVIFISPGETSELADAMTAIMNDSELRDKLRTSSIARAEKTLRNTASEQHATFLEKLT